MRRITTFVAATAFAVLGFAPAASAGELCYDVYLDVNGNVVAQADCVETP